MGNPNKLKFLDSATLSELSTLLPEHFVLIRTAEGFAVAPPSLVGAAGGGGGGSAFTYYEWDAQANEVGVGMPLVQTELEEVSEPPLVLDSLAGTLTFPTTTNGYQAATVEIQGRFPSTGTHWFAINSDENQGMADLAFSIRSRSKRGETVLVEGGLYSSEVYIKTDAAGGRVYWPADGLTPGFAVIIDPATFKITVGTGANSRDFFCSDLDQYNELMIELWVATYDNAAPHVFTINRSDAASSPMTIPVGALGLDLRMTQWPELTNGTLVKIVSDSRLGAEVIMAGDSGVFYNNQLLLSANYDKIARLDSSASFSKPIFIQETKFNAVNGAPRVGDVFPSMPFTGTLDVAYGHQIASKMTSGDWNVLVGVNVFENMDRGDRNVAMGRFSGYHLGTAISSIGIGDNSMNGGVGGYKHDTCVSIGYQAGGQIIKDPLFTGDYASSPFTPLVSRVAIGDSALSGGMWGASIVAIGTLAGAGVMGSENQDGDDCVFIGSNAGADLTTNTASGFFNARCIAIGKQAASLGTNLLEGVAVGQNAFYWGSGQKAVAVGSEALYRSNAPGSVGVGTRAMRRINGASNVAVGNEAMDAGGASIGITNCTAIGYRAMMTPLEATTNSTAVGNEATVTGSNQVQLGNAATTTYVYGTVQSRSDLRDKTEVRNTELGLEFIEKLRPVDYRWDMREDYIDYASLPVAPMLPAALMSPPHLPEDDPDYPAAQALYVADQTRYVEEMRDYDAANEAYIAAMAVWYAKNDMSAIVHDGSKTRSRFHHGLIAQEVKATIDEMGIDFGGYQDHSIDGGQDVRSLGYEEFIAPLIRSVQQLSQQLRETQAELAELKQQLGG